MALAHPQENIAKLNLSEGERVADFGAGSGHYTIETAKAVGEDGHVYAIEIQKKLVSKVESKAESAGLENVNVIWGDLEKPEGSTLEDDLVDVVVLANILFQAKDKEQLFQESQRVLKPNGRLLVVDWTDSHGGLGPQEDHLVPENRSRLLAEDVGFTHKQGIDPGDHHYGMIFSQ